MRTEILGNVIFWVDNPNFRYGHEVTKNHKVDRSVSHLEGANGCNSKVMSIQNKGETKGPLSSIYQGFQKVYKWQYVGWSTVTSKPKCRLW